MRYLTSILLSLLLFFLTTSTINAQGIYTTDKLITVDTASQKLTAWEGGQIQHQSTVSTGMWLTPTVKGTFKIYWKTPLQDMRGPSPYTHIYPSGRYHIKNVQHAMYFHQAYAIHGTWWHSNFGSPASHGCVNMSTQSAEWLYNWAPIGTTVVVW